MFTFTPMTESEALNLLPPGEYQFEVESCIPAQSKKTGLPQLNVTLKVYSTNGSIHIVKDFLSEHYMQHKLRHFLICLFGEDAYKEGKIDPRFAIGKGAVVKIYIDEPKDKKFDPKNAVVDYYRSEAPALIKPDELNDEVPF